jgi:TetR/AcrR family transcriptional repressor of nem operon
LFTKATVELADRDPDVAVAARRAYRRLEDEYAGCIEQAQAAGEVDATLDARALATYFVAVTRGMEVLGAAGADRSVILDVGRVALTLLTGSARGSGSGAP